LLSIAADGGRVASARMFVCVYVGALLSRHVDAAPHRFDARREVACAVHEAAV
jgi:hypothetical protein